MVYVRPRPRTKYAGIYGIRHTSGATYVGASTDMTGRWTHHRFNLRRGTHKSKPLQIMWIASGEEAFEFIVLEHCAPTSENEQRHMEAQTILLNGSKFARPKPEPSDKRKAAARLLWSDPEYRIEFRTRPRNQGRFDKETVIS